MLNTPIDTTTIHRLSQDDPRFPVSLKSIPPMRHYGRVLPPPQTLWCQGNLSLLNSLSIAIVGTRHPTEVGVRVAKHITRRLVEAENYTIVAGLAVGIDTAAHERCLEFGGHTIAVLADITPGRVWPDAELAQRILANHGLLIAEHAPDSLHRFVKGEYADRLIARDRLQSGLSIATIPVQAGVGSGTLHTIRSAREQGRRVFAPTPYASDCRVYAAPYAGLIQVIEQEEWFYPGGDMTQFLHTLAEIRPRW